MFIRNWFIANNDHYQVLPSIRWTTEVYRWMEDYTWKCGGWAYNFGISFAWLSLSTGFFVSGYLTKRHDSQTVQPNQ